MKIRTICCIGAGYVGGPTMAVIADQCPAVEVIVVDTNQEKIDAWNSSVIPIYEPGLAEIVERRINKNLFFTTLIDESIKKADCVFISVNTPTKTYGHGAGKACDLSFLEESARRIAKAASGHTIVVEKSTLPVRSAETVKSILDSLGGEKTFDILSNPEFLAEGTAVKDLLHPDRILIGGSSTAACHQLAQLYLNWVPPENIITTNLWSSEMAKIAANAFLAQRVSSINSLSGICEVTGANIKDVVKSIGKDSRIGEKFLRPGPGFGGSCFKKDILSLVYLCEYYALNEVAAYWYQVLNINDWQMRRITRLVVRKMYNTVSNKQIAIFGYAFKQNTNDIRESPAIIISRELLLEGAHLIIYDPKVESEKIYQSLEGNSSISAPKVKIAGSLLEALNGTDAVIIVTDWEEFQRIDWRLAASNMRPPSWVFDTRLCLDGRTIKAAGLNYWGTGLPIGEESGFTEEMN